jgi:hypothetical protein
MPADHDDRIEDVLLHRVVAELRRPVALDPALDRRVLERIQGTAGGRTIAGRGYRWGAWMAGAAIAAGLLLTVITRGPEHEAAPARTATDQRSVASDARPVYLHLDAPTSSRVSVVGDFNDWDPSATPLKMITKDGRWMVELRLKPGRYHYRFLLDGRRWERDPSGPPSLDSDFGAPVSVLTVI